MKLTHRFYIYTTALFLIAMAVFFYLTHIENERLLREAGLLDARRLGGAFFGELYTSMSLGGGAEGDRAIMERYKNIAGVESIKVVHAPVINKTFGAEADERADDDFEQKGLGGTEAYKIIENKTARHRSMRLVMPIRFKAKCRGCHKAPPSSLAGLVSLQVSLVRYEAIVASHERYLLLCGLLVIIFSGILILAALRRHVLRPLLSLKNGLDSIQGGDLAKRVRVTSHDEFEEVGSAFNLMAESLEKTSADLKDAVFNYASLVEMAADAIVLIDAKSMVIVEVNRAAELLTCLSKEELCQKNATDLYVTTTRKEAYKASFKRWVFDGKGYAHDSLIEAKQGGAVPVDISASVIERNGRRFVLEIWRDITERKFLEDGMRSKILELEERVGERTRELEEAYEKLKRSQQQIVQSAKLVSLGEMGAGIAHELNSPLAGILTIVEVLLGRMDRNDRNYEMLKKIKDAAVRSKYIIIDMLSYARSFKGDFEPLNLNEVLKSTLSLFVSEINYASTEVSLDLCANPAPVFGARGQLMEVFLNLIKNARDALSVNGCITLSTYTVNEAEGLMIVAEINDNGKGIPEEIIERIFDPFFSTKEKGGGLNIGLGLSISQSIVKEHGGRLEVKNRARGGASFSIILPAIIESEAEDSLKI